MQSVAWRVDVVVEVDVFVDVAVAVGVGVGRRLLRGFRRRVVDLGEGPGLGFGQSGTIANRAWLF